MTDQKDTVKTADAGQKSTRVDKTQIKLAREAFDALAFLNNIDWTQHREKLLAMCKAEEKDHRGFMPEFTSSHTADTASVSDCAKLFATKRVAEYLQGWLEGKPSFPNGKDFLHMQKSCFYAAGLVDAYGEKIREAWNEAGVIVNDVALLDYTAVVKVRRDETESEGR
jgi:hypothetical protein